MKGLALEGGGVKGAYHIGVMTALREMGLADFDGYVGTSIGAINAAMFCAGDWEKPWNFGTISICITSLIWTNCR